jgi:hypothetical protein
MSECVHVCREGAGTDPFWHVHTEYREHKRHQSLFALVSFVIFRTQCIRMSQFEDQVNIKFCVQLGKTFTKL